MAVCLNTIELGAEQRELARESIRKIAYFMWEEAGCPPGQALDFWLKAERQWIERCYVPQRPLEEPGSRAADQPEELAEAAAP